MSIVQYETLGADDLRNLDEEVNAAIADGWQPFGSIACATSGHLDEIRYVYVQPMVRYD